MNLLFGDSHSKNGSAFVFPPRRLWKSTKRGVFFLLLFCSRIESPLEEGHQTLFGGSSSPHAAAACVISVSVKKRSRGQQQQIHGDSHNPTNNTTLDQLRRRASVKQHTQDLGVPFWSLVLGNSLKCFYKHFNPRRLSGGSSLQTSSSSIFGFSLKLDPIGTAFLSQLFPHIHTLQIGQIKSEIGVNDKADWSETNQLVLPPNINGFIR